MYRPNYLARPKLGSLVDRNVYDRAGRHVGHVDCCGEDRNGDHWPDGMVISHDISVLVAGITNADLSGGRFYARSERAGQDIWDYTTTVEFDWVDGTKAAFSCRGENNCSTQW
jgi:hypothetical protein